MPDDDVCGYEETTTGEPCQHPAGSCPVSSHDDGDSDQGAGNGGRPSKYTEDRREAILEAARSGTTVEGCARAAGVGVSTLYDWLDDYPDFSEAFNRARAQGEQQLVEEVAAEDPQFILERSYDYVKTERREITGEDGGPVEVTINEEIVETGFGDDS